MAVVWLPIPVDNRFRRKHRISVIDVQETMSEDLDELAATVAGVLVSALAGDSWQDAKQWFAAVLGHEGRLAATRAELVNAGDGPARDLAVQAQVRAWTVRLRDVFEDSPASARTLQDLVAGMRAQGLLKPPAAGSRQDAPAAVPQSAFPAATAPQPVLDLSAKARYAIAARS
jgi:hypothetical protein